MVYYLDGYNLIFTLIDSSESIASQRQNLVLYLQKQFAILGLSGTLVFDGAHRRDEESGLSYKSPLVIAYAPKGQSADSYIVEHLEREKNPKQATVVTNDRGLTRHARALGAKVMGNVAFIAYLRKKKAKKKSAVKVESKESKGNVERLMKIFEERLKNSEDFE